MKDKAIRTRDLQTKPANGPTEIRGFEGLHNTLARIGGDPRARTQTQGVGETGQPTGASNAGGAATHGADKGQDGSG